MTRDPLKLVVSLTISFAIPAKKPIIADHNYSQDLHAVHPVACATTLKKDLFLIKTLAHLLLFRNGMYQELHPHVVNIRNEDG